MIQNCDDIVIIRTKRKGKWSKSRLDLTVKRIEDVIKRIDIKCPE